MHQTKLVQILSRFEKNEIKQFEVFLASPYFNTSDKILNFYRILVQYYPTFDSPKLDKEKIYQELHKKPGFNVQTMRELSSDLFKLAKEYISQQQMKDKNIEANYQRHLWLVDRGLRKMTEQELALRNEMLDNYSLHCNDYYYQRWMADYNEFSHKTTALWDREHKIETKEGEHPIHALNRYYVVSFFESYIFLTGLSKIYNKEVDQSLAIHIVALAERYIGQGDLLIDIYYNIYQLLYTREEKYYFELKSIFLRDDRSVPLEIRLEVSINLENYCLQSIRNGNLKFQYEIMEIFHFVIEHGIMLQNGEVSHRFYQNVVTNGVDVGEIDWVETFMEKYRDQIALEFRESVYDYCMAYILFANRKFEEALRITTAVGVFNEFTKIDIKNLTARIHYELGMFDQLNTLLESYPYHLKSEVMTASRRENHSLFFSFMKQLVSLKQRYSVGGWEKINTDINQTLTFTNKPWFQQKMAEMKPAHQV